MEQPISSAKALDADAMRAIVADIGPVIGIMLDAEKTFPSTEQSILSFLTRTLDQQDCVVTRILQTGTDLDLAAIATLGSMTRAMLLGRIFELTRAQWPADFDLARELAPVLAEHSLLFQMFACVGAPVAVN